MTGQYGIHHGLVGHGGTAGDIRTEGESRRFRANLASSSLAGWMQKQGAHTALISPFAQRHGTWSFYAGFREILNTGKDGMEIADDVTPVVEDWLERRGRDEDWFLYVNYWDAHTPYRTPETFGEPFAEEPLPDWLTDEVLEAHKRKVGPHSASEINMYNSEENPKFPRYPGSIRDRDDLRRMIDGYDSGIRYIDEHIGKLMSKLSELGLEEEVAVIITADHGENMGQLGIYGEHATADRATCRIPMIIRWPGTKQGHVDDQLHVHIDLLPTLAELLGDEADESWDGQSYADTLRRGAEEGRPYAVLSQCAHVCQRSVRFDKWLYIRTYHDGFHLFQEEMLFDLEADPHEQYNLATARRDQCMEAVYHLQSWHDQMMRTMPEGIDRDPLWTVMSEGGPFHAKGHLQHYAERLEQTGRGGGAAELRRRHPHDIH